MSKVIVGQLLIVVGMVVLLVEAFRWEPNLAVFYAGAVVVLIGVGLMVSDREDKEAERARARPEPKPIEAWQWPNR